MPVTITPKLLIFDDAAMLADLRSIKMDIEFSFFCFERFDVNKLFKFEHLGEDRRHYAIATAALIHYRRAFNGGQRKYKILDSIPADEIFHHNINKEICDIASKQLAHSASSYELVGAPINVAIDHDTGIATYRGIGGNSTFGSLMSEQRRLDAIVHLHYILQNIIDPETRRLENSVTEKASSLSSEDLHSLPDGFPPRETDLLKQRNWPPRT